MTTEAQFLDEADRRGYRRETIFLLPGPDEQRNPEGGVFVEAPRSGRADGAWRTYRMDRGVQDEARFDHASDAYDHVLDTFLATRRQPPMTRERFLDEVARRGGKASWFVLRTDASADTDTDTARADVPDGRVVVAPDPDAAGSWRTHVQDRGERDVHRFDSESEALRYVLESAFGR